ncbi:MAG: hypothetical protein E3J87_03445, partial [Candidatus Cloacimonadota bacterium]
AKRQPHDSYNVACEFKPDLVFCSRTQALTWKVSEIKARFKNAITCIWNVDTRTQVKRWAYLFPLINNCDYHFIPDTKTIPQWKRINPNTFWLPQGLQDEVYDKPKEITSEDKAKYSCDVSFAGSVRGSHKNRHFFLNAIKEMGLSYKFWGCYGIPRIYNEEHNKMVSLSRVNIAMSGWPGNGKYTSVRNYKILGAGGFALELYREGIYEIFPENVIRCYTSPGDLAKKVRHWLDHNQERQGIADAGYEWVHANATYTHRIRMALDYMELN